MHGRQLDPTLDSYRTKCDEPLGSLVESVKDQQLFPSTHSPLTPSSGTSPNPSSTGPLLSDVPLVVLSKSSNDVLTPAPLCKLSEHRGPTIHTVGPASNQESSNIIHPKHVPPENAIHRVPTEILGVAFTYLAVHEVSLSVSGTCRRWALAVLRTPELRGVMRYGGVHLLGGAMQARAVAPSVGFTTIPSVPVVGYRCAKNDDKEWNAEVLPATTTSRVHNAVAVLNRRMYAIGGRWQNDRLSSMDKFDPMTGVWSAGPSMSEPRSGAGACGLRGKVWVFGGTNGSVDVSAVDVFNPSTCRWEDRGFVPDMPLPASEVSVVSVGSSFVYVVGGRSRSGQVLNAVRILNVVTKTWSMGPSMKVGRAGCAVGVVGSRLWAAGGSDKGRAPLGTTEYVDLSSSNTSEWTAGPSMTTQRSNATGCVVQGKTFVVVSGFCFGPLKSVEYLNHECRWVAGKDLPNKVDAGKAVVLE